MPDDQASLVYTYTDKSTHTIVVQFAAKAPAILCNLILTPVRSRAAVVAQVRSGSGGGGDGLLPQLVAVLGPHWERLVADAHSLGELQRAMHQIDLEMGRMQALDGDLRNVLRRFVVPQGVEVVGVGDVEARSGAYGVPRGMETVCRFTVGFSCLSPASTVGFSCLAPASKWSVRLSVKRGYTFGWVEIAPQSEFRAKPLDVTGIADVAFGYGRLERACEHLEKIFDAECARVRAENGED